MNHQSNARFFHDPWDIRSVAGIHRRLVLSVDLRFELRRERDVMKEKGHQG